MAELIYRPIVKIFKGFWRYLDLDFRFHGQAHVPRSGAALLAMNHVSYLDFAIAGTALLDSNRLARFMAKRELFDHPISGPLMRGMRHISVDRRNGAPSFVEALKALKKGEIVGVFPEATISRSFELKEMKSGVIRLAMESGAPVLPTIIWGSQRLWTKKVPRNLTRAQVPIIVSFGAPLHFSPTEDAEVALARLKSAMQLLLDNAQSEYPDSPIGQRWAPARLGGTAPTPKMVELESRERRKEI
jgi:1-acyl-sn-glycerol-3-phosphate acyltransferase